MRLRRYGKLIVVTFAVTKTSLTESNRKDSMKSRIIKLALFAFAFGMFQWTANATEAEKTINGKKYLEHLVKKGETLFGICKKYNTSVAEMERVNPSLKNGLKSEVKILVPATGQPVTAKNESAKPIASNASTSVGTDKELVEHLVKPGETLTSIARKYNTSISDLSTRNEKLVKNGLKSGTTLKVLKNSSLKTSVPATTKAKTETASAATQKTASHTEKPGSQAANGYSKYKVKKGETLYAICKRQGCTVSEAEELNPKLKKRAIIEGEVLTLPAPHSNASQKKKNDKSGLTVHEVKKGETLYGIANTYNVSANDIERLNPGVKNSGIKAGKALIMPPTSKYLADKNSTPDFRIHKVGKDETVFSISKKFNINPNDVTANNDVRNGLKVGQLLAIPPSAKEKEKTGVASVFRHNAPASEPKHSNIAHTVLKGETMFSLCKTYKISEYELTSVNPELKADGLQAGKIIFIPRTPDRKYSWNSSYFVSTQGNNKVHVAVLLPFNTEDGQIDNNTDKFLEFYQGILLAAKTLKEQNVWVYLHVYNSGKTEADINALLEKEEMKNMDIMIGPAYKAQFAPMGKFALENNVKMIVPFSSRTEEMKTNPNIFLVNAPKSKMAQENAQSFAELFKGKNVVVAKFKGEKQNDKQEVADSIAAKLRSLGTPVKEIEFTNAEALKESLKEKEENLVLTTSTDQVALTQLIPSVNSMLVQKYDVKIFGYNEWTKYQTIAKDLFVAETYIGSAYDINFEDSASKEFIGNFRKYYGQEPGNTQPMYGALGYDIMLYFGKAVALFGKNFEHGLSQLSKENLHTIQSDFKFKRYSEEGGFYNSDVTISRNNGTDGHVLLNKQLE